MTTPPNIDDADRAPEGGEDRGDWAAWEKTFRDARPVLPDAAMQRIDQAIKLEVQRAMPKAARPRRWLQILAGCLLVGAVAWLLMGTFMRPTPGTAIPVEERLPLTFSTGPRHVGPTTSALPLAEEHQITIHAAGKSVDQGIATYRGPITVSIAPIRITCDTLTVFHGSDADSRLLSGKGAVHGENISIVGMISGDEFTFNTATGTLVFTGNVHVSIDGKAAVRSSLTITADGKVRATPQ